MTTEFPRESLEPGLRAAGELFLDFYENLDSRRVDPGVDRQASEAAFAGTLDCEEGIGLEQAVLEFREQVAPRSMTTPHPLYMGLVNSSPLPGAAIADLLISMLNNNAGSFHQSPGLSGIESEVLRSFSGMLGLPPSTTGMVLPGGSLATLQALILARATHFPESRATGLAGLSRPPVLYTADTSHFSVSRSAQSLGFGERHVRALPSLGRGAIDVQALAAAVQADRQARLAPFCVIATLGTTGTGALDPLAEIAELCEAEGLWLHVDACYGGAVALLEEFRDDLRGIDRADSVAIDPHKWFFTPITAGMLLTRRADAEHAAFELDASYIPGDAGDTFRRGFPTSRRASAAAVWMGLRAHGWARVRQAVRDNIAQCRLLEDRLVARGFRVLPDGRLSIACARYEPDGFGTGELDALQGRIARAAVATGRCWFSTTRHDGATWLRCNLVNLHTRDHHVEQFADLLAEVARVETGR